MKLIKISTDMELTTHEFPDGTITEQNKAIRDLIGGKCDTYEHVMPVRLYADLHHKSRPTKVSGQCVSMLIDECGLINELELNLIGSYLYGTDLHGNPIVGDILFVGEEWGNDGIDFCGIEESVFKTLELQLNNMIYAMKATKQVVESVKEDTNK